LQGPEEDGFHKSWLIDMAAATPPVIAALAMVGVVVLGLV
jgi:hypothetical protein